MTARDTRRQRIRERQSFGTRRDSLTAEGHPATGWIGEGWLYSAAPRWAAELSERRPHISYVIYSYATPIAWYDDELGWAVPDVRYSVTTSGHQHEVHSALSVGWVWNGRELEQLDTDIPYRTVPLGVLRDTYFTFDGDVSDETRDYLTRAGSLKGATA